MQIQFKCREHGHRRGKEMVPDWVFIWVGAWEKRGEIGQKLQVNRPSGCLKHLLGGRGLCRLHRSTQHMLFPRRRWSEPSIWRELRESDYMPTSKLLRKLVWQDIQRRSGVCLLIKAGPFDFLIHVTKPETKDASSNWGGGRLKKASGGKHAREKSLRGDFG